ncbi:hypothetical protein AAFC00_002004 [Neodothiora populina]|uniref:Choline transporter n=1 Tax=Neodothiora populina TaxID=2781224 RepID=A0ABR3PFY4_9PEZI
MSFSLTSSDDEKRMRTIDNEKAVTPGSDGIDRRTSEVTKEGEVINASGHRDQLTRQYGLLSICGLALTIDNAWVALGGSLTISLVNGGPPGVLYEFLTACVYYGFIGASIAELTSSMPSAGGVYHWASVTPGPNWGRSIGFFTGWLNWFGWIFDAASIAYIPANVLVQMYAVFHDDFVVEAWHTYVAFVCVTWLSCAICIFGNRFIPYLQHIGLFLLLAGGLITIIVVAAMPEKHASNAFVWTDWNNTSGWGDGVAFLTGVLNGAFTIGTPDAITHMAEELPNPKTDMPKAVGAQILLGTITAFIFAIAVFYGINDLDAVLNSSGSFPLAEAYAQATGSKGGTFGLLLILFLSVMVCVIGTFLTLGRIFWALARDRATPFHSFFSKVDERLSCPVPATVLTAIMVTGFGAISLGSATAFSDLVGSFIILTTASYFLAIFPNLLTGRKHLKPGPFHMGKLGYAINAISCVLIIFFDTMFCFPYGMPVTADISLMNWNSVILVGIIVLISVWWLVYGAHKYPGPKIVGVYTQGVQ